MSNVGPLANLELRTSRTVLKGMSDDHIVNLARASQGNVLGPGQETFLTDWVRAKPETYVSSFAQYHWGCRDSWSPNHWTFSFGVFIEGHADPVGIQGLSASQFSQLRVVSTGSWLLRDFQGQGLGKLMRASVLQLAFAGLGADYAVTSAAMDNEVSKNVTQSMGYKENGLHFSFNNNQRVTEQHYLLDKADWKDRSDIEIIGLQECLQLFGAA